jgi:hypothetical protein
MLTLARLISHDFLACWIAGLCLLALAVAVLHHGLRAPR